jgi:hypothetical protein
MAAKVRSEVSTVANVLKRLSSLVAIALGGLFGYWVAGIVFGWLSCSYSAQGMGSAWGSGVAAAIVIWKSATSATETVISAWWYIRQRNAYFDHTKALLGIATIAFGIVLGIRTFVPGVKQRVPLRELVYVVWHQGRVTPPFTVAPSLLFNSAGLRDPDIEPFSDATEITPDVFVDGSVSLTNGQVESICGLASKLATEYISDSADDTLSLKVYGFANDRPIPDGTMLRRQDSDILNLAIANLRGQSLYEACTTSFAGSFPELREKVTIDWKAWESLREMQYCRDNEVFPNTHIAPSALIDHRSAVLVVSSPGTRPQLDSPQGR